MRELLYAETEECKQKLNALTDELKILLLPKDKNDDRKTSTSSASGRTATVTVEVCTLPCDSVSGTRWTR